MFLSLIICTRSRAPQLQKCLASVAAAARPAAEMEVVIVDNGSTDTTADVIKDFATTSELKVQTTFSETPGKGRSLNVGLGVAKGEWLLFTDDDCYVEPAYFQNFCEFVKVSAGSPEAKKIKYGTGPILPFDKQHDPRIATLIIDKIELVPPQTLMPAGLVQGANMFFHKTVFATAGKFNDNMGPGTPFVCEDIEMAARASLAGFTGARLPFFKVTHHHGRLIGSAEADKTVEAYDYSRGAYYAAMIDRGFSQFWKMWEALSLQNTQRPGFRQQLARELEGAAKYLTSLSDE